MWVLYFMCSGKSHVADLSWRSLWQGCGRDRGQDAGSCTSCANVGWICVRSAAALSRFFFAEQAVHHMAPSHRHVKHGLTAPPPNPSTSDLPPASAVGLRTWQGRGSASHQTPESGWWVRHSLQQEHCWGHGFPAALQSPGLQPILGGTLRPQSCTLGSTRTLWRGPGHSGQGVGSTGGPS